MVLLPSKMVPFSIVKNCVFVWTGKNNSKTQRVDAEFFENGEKVSVSKQKWIRVDWAKVD